MRKNHGRKKQEAGFLPLLAALAPLAFEAGKAIYNKVKGNGIRRVGNGVKKRGGCCKKR